jgi:hypothetical protein
VYLGGPFLRETGRNGWPELYSVDSSGFRGNIEVCSFICRSGSSLQEKLIDELRALDCFRCYFGDHLLTIVTFLVMCIDLLSGLLDLFCKGYLGEMFDASVLFASVCCRVKKR